VGTYFLANLLKKLKKQENKPKLDILGCLPRSALSGFGSISRLCLLWWPAFCFIVSHRDSVSFKNLEKSFGK